MSQPVMLVQMRRLGDLILTFPLLLALQKHYPASPLHIVAQPAFFKGLMPFAPAASFFYPDMLPELGKLEYEAIFNFGAGAEAASFTAAASARAKYGELLIHKQTHIEGFWQLYRAALTHNNRHNLFHWADLNRLDLTSPDAWPRHGLKPPPGKGRVGLFIGASEKAKRPQPQFWIELAKRLAANGLFPVFLGGPAEKESGELIAKKTGLEKVNFCGKTSLAQLANILTSLDVLITPDTGPMHLADWLGTRVLNLSMGNVNANETGPLAPGQLVLRAAMSCAGCWSCARKRLYCQDSFRPALVSRVARAILDNSIADLPPLRGLELLQTGRDRHGLHMLKKLSSNGMNATPALDLFWKKAFLNLYIKDAKSQDETFQFWENIEKLNPALAASIRAHLGKLAAQLLSTIRGGRSLPDSFWQRQPRHSRLFAGWLQMLLENGNNSENARHAALEHIATLAHIMETKV